ncbi:DUF4258 domain-containing protein [Pseudoduganella sp.]|uniref:DUF4258 domain-containing protein n=1 Tax=Pseudoduganella sp. TaxID=1880898 RepID=UPI0035B45DD8
MAQPTIRQFRNLVRAGHYRVSLHAREGLEDDGLFEKDFRRIILGGRIVEHQVDRGTGERKYLVFGRTCDGRPAYSAVKIETGSGRLVAITVYAVA